MQDIMIEMEKELLRRLANNIMWVIRWGHSAEQI